MGEMTVGRDQLANYLLRRASAEDSAQITERLFSDDNLTAELEAVERDLLDAYARGELSAPDRAAVETCLLTSDSQHEKLRFAVAFARRANAAESNRVRRWLAVAAVVLIVVGLSATAGILFMRTRALERELSSLRAGEVRASARQADDAAVSFLVDPAERGGRPEILKIAPGTTLIRLDFILGSASVDAVDVRIATDAGALVVEQRSAKTANISGAFLVSVWLPVTALAPGAYSAAVTQSRGNQEIDYGFRIVLPK